MTERTAVVDPVETLSLHVEPNDALKEALAEFYDDDFKHEVGNIALRSTARVPIVRSGGSVSPMVFDDGTHDLSPSAALVRTNNEMFPFRNHQVPFFPYVDVTKTREDTVLRLNFAAMPLYGIRKALNSAWFLPLDSPEADWSKRSIHMILDIPARKVAHSNDTLKGAYKNLAHLMSDGEAVDIKKGKWTRLVTNTHIYGERPALRISNE